MPEMVDPAVLLEKAIDTAFAAKALRPTAFGGDQGCEAATAAVLAAVANTADI